LEEEKNFLTSHELNQDLPVYSPVTMLTMLRQIQDGIIICEERTHGTHQVQNNKEEQ